MSQIKTNDTVTRIRALARVALFKQLGRKRRLAAERRERGTDQGIPMDNEVRASHYLRQSGSQRLTPRQLRRINKKMRKSLRQVAGDA